MRTGSILVALCLAVASLPATAATSFDREQTVRPAPDFELPATDGSVMRLSDLRGRYVMINFWAVWCTPCRREMPSLQRVADSLKSERFELLGIHVGPSLDGARDFAVQLGLEFRILVDEGMDLATWRVMGLPTTFLVDPEGQIIATAVGEREWDAPEMIDRIMQLMRDG